MRRRAARITTEDVHEHARLLMGEHGLHAVTPHDIAARLRSTPDAVLRIEPEFGAFVAELFRRAVSAELAEVKRAVLVHPDPLAQLDVLVGLLAEPVHVEVTAAWVEAFSLGRCMPELADVARQEEDAWQRFVASVVHRGAREGSWTAEHPAAVAAQLLAVIDGVNAYALIGYDTGVPRRRMLELVVEHGLGVRFGEQPVPGETAAVPR